MAPADAALARRLPRRRRRAAAGAHRLRAGRPVRRRARGRGTARPRAPPSTRTRPRPRRSRWRPGPTPTRSRRSGRCCWPSWSASRSRTCGSTSRTATAAAPTPRRTPTPSPRVAAVRGRTAPPFWGVRFKCLEAPTRRARAAHARPRARRRARRGPAARRLPAHAAEGHLRRAGGRDGAACERLEAAYGLDHGRLRFEVQVETPQAVLGPDGAATVARLMHAADGRCTGLHFGTYDYTAALGIAAGHQAMDHPVADHAKNVMQVAAAGTGVPVSDGSTNVLPVGSARSRCGRRGRCTPGWCAGPWSAGFYQGWDLHPAQLPTRFLATFLFYRVRPGRGGRPAARLPRRGRGRASSTSRRRPGRWPASCAAACTAAPSPPTRWSG